MSTEHSKSSMLNRIRTIADFQFGSGVGGALFPDECEFRLSSTRRIRYVMLEGERLATVRAQDGRLTLGIIGAARLRQALAPPAYRAVIMEEVATFIAGGKNAFARHITAADPGIRAGDEVMVTTADDELLGTGVAMLSGAEMLAFNYGVAVKLRQGREAGCSPEK